MEELVKMLIDQRAIATETERWVLHPERLRATQVPLTLTGVLQARLDSLTARQKVTLQAASVIGYVFWDRALVALDTHAHDTLPQLVKRELVIPGRTPRTSCETSCANTPSDTTSCIR